MSAGDARHGRRDNGLIAAEYAAAGDVDPRVGEHLLDVLELDGIAAYLRPSTDLHPVDRSTTLPGRPTDRLYVDRTHLGTARDLVARFAEDEARAEPESAPDQSVEDAWAQIVAGYELDTPGRSWPDAEDLPEQQPAGPRRVLPPLVITQSVDPPEEEPSLLDGLDTFGADLPDEEDEHYTPPAAPPLPRPSLPTALAILGIICGLVLFLEPTVLPVSESVAMLTGFSAVMGGFATLVWRLRPGDDDEDDDPENGARV